MGQGTIVLFDWFNWVMGTGQYDFRTGAHDIEVFLATNAVVPTKTDAAPVKADYTECSGGTYSAQAVTNGDWTQTVNQSDFKADDITFAQDAGAGPIDCYYAIAYDDNGLEPCFWFWDLTADGGTTPLSLRDAPIVLNLGSGTRQIFYSTVPAND